MEALEMSLMKAGEQAIHERFPDFQQGKRTPTLRDRGDHWEFTYELPPGALGGSPVALIDKESRRIIRIYRTQ